MNVIVRIGKAIHFGVFAVLLAVAIPAFADEAGSAAPPGVTATVATQADGAMVRPVVAAHSAVGDHAAHTYLYVPTIGQGGAGTIDEFRLDGTGALVPLKPVVKAGLYPYGVTIDPQARYCYLAQWVSPGTIDQYVIGTEGSLSSSAMTSIRTGREPYPVTFTPDDKTAVVSNNLDYTLATYSVGDNGALKPITTIRTGKEARALAIDPSGKYVYAAYYEWSTIAQFALGADGALTPVATVATGQLPYCLTVGPTGNYLYAANRGSGNISIYAINPNTGALTLTAMVPSGSGEYSGANWITFDPAGQYAYVTNERDNGISQFSVDSKTGMLTRTPNDTRVGMSPVGVTVDPSGRFLFVANSLEPTISEFCINEDATLSTGVVVHMHGQKDVTVGGPVKLSGTPWLVAVVRK